MPNEQLGLDKKRRLMRDCEEKCHDDAAAMVTRILDTWSLALDGPALPMTCVATALMKIAIISILVVDSKLHGNGQVVKNFLEQAGIFAKEQTELLERRDAKEDKHE